MKMRITQTVPERIKRLPLKIAIRVSRHVVIEERRKLIQRFIKSHRQPSAGVGVSKEYIGDGISAPLTGVPRFHDGGDMFVGPVHGQGASVQQDQDDGFAQLVNGLHQFPLDARQLERIPVASAKAFQSHAHLFPFQARGQPHYHHDYIGLLRNLDSLLQEWAIMSGPNKLGQGLAMICVEFKHNFILLIFFKIDGFRPDDRMMPRASLNQQGILEIETAPVKCERAQFIRSRLRRDEITGPANPEIVIIQPLIR